MVFDFDLRLFCENLKATKPPYECPAPGCGRVYKTYIGIQFHLFNYDHENPDGKSSSTQGNGDSSKQLDASKKGHHRQVRHPSSPGRVSQEESEHELSSSSISPHNVSAKSQRVVEITLDGRIHRIDVYDPMNIVVRQSQPLSSSEKNLDVKPPDLVACTTLSAKTDLGEPMIGDTVPVTDACSLFTASTAVNTNNLSETESKRHVADMPMENVAAFVPDTDAVKSSCGIGDCSDEENGKATLTACSTDACNLPPSECLASDSCASSSNSVSIPCDSVEHNILISEMKTEAHHEESVNPSTVCVEKNSLFSDDANIPVSSSELVQADIASSTCLQTPDCDTEKSCNSLSASTVVVSKPAPTKMSLPTAEFKILSDYMRPPKITGTAQRPEYYKFKERTSDELDAVVEYDMDEEVCESLVFQISYKMCLVYNVDFISKFANL